MPKNSQKSPHEMAISHIILATHEAEKGNAKRVDAHIGHAKNYADAHASALKMMGRGDEANRYQAAFSDHLRRIDSILKNKKRKSEGLACSEDHEMVKTCTKCGYMNKAEKWEVSGPKKDRRYKYKAIHELSPEHQASAWHKFQGKEMGRHLYPVDEEGNLVHAARVPMPANELKAPKPLSSEYNVLEPHHRIGSAVRIKEEGHPSHGKLGIVRGVNPSLGGKITVQVGSSSSEMMHLDPKSLAPSQATNKVEKALVAYWGIQKALLK